MDLKSNFLNGYIQEKVFIDQPPSFINPTILNHVFKLKKALYGLKQTTMVWYDRLSKFLLENKFQRGQIDKYIFIKKTEHDILLIQIYVDIIFGATNESLCEEFCEIMYIMGLHNLLRLEYPKSRRYICRRRALYQGRTRLHDFLTTFP
ncbi:unnamed protein product [Lathyrus oleraceus]